MLVGRSTVMGNTFDLRSLFPTLEDVAEKGPIGVIEVVGEIEWVERFPVPKGQGTFTVAAWRGTTTSTTPMR